jgi:NAD(P)H-nitrite reductase large subunit
MRLVIIGNGVAGITCAFEARRRDPTIEVVVISKETPFFFSRTALMYAFMDTLQRRDLEPFERETYKRNNIELVQDTVVDLNAGERTLSLVSGATLAYDRLVLATGSVPNMVPWKGVDSIRDGLAHFVSMQDLDTCERLTQTTRQAVVVGGGLIGIELAECLAFHGVKVTFLVREPYFWPVALGSEEAAYVGDHMRAHGIDVRYAEEIEEIRVDSSGRVSEVLTNRGGRLPAQLLGVCVGVRPCIDWLKRVKTPPRLERGIVVDALMQTSLDGVFACGDCAEILDVGQRGSLIELFWYSAKRQGALVAGNLFGDGKSYVPPLFFNSSKFFEIEYTTVGTVMEMPAGSDTIYLKVPGKNASVRIVHHSNRVVGFNMLGSRWDHNVLEKWIDERRSPSYCLENLRDAQFDVEFGRLRFEKVPPLSVPLTVAP